MKKSIAMLLALTLTAATAGCSNSASSTPASTSGPSSSAGASSSSASSVAAEKVKFSATFLQNEWHGDPNEMEVFKKLENVSNVEVDWQIYSAGTWKDKKNLLISSGDLPDVMYMSTVDSDDVVKYGPQGMFIDLADLIPKYAPRLNTLFTEMPNYKAVCINPDDGKVYSIARAAERDVQYTQSLHYINKKWLDQLGLQIPKTTDEYYQVLKAFKEKDPNGNGKPDEIPFEFFGNHEKSKQDFQYGALLGSFGYPDLSYSTLSHLLKDTKTGKLVYNAMEPGYRDGIAFYSKMVAEGLWDKEGFTYADTAPMTAKGNNDPQLLGSFTAFDSSFIVPTAQLADYVILEPLAGPNGDRQWLYYGASNGNINGTQFVMTQAAQGKEEGIMRWLDAHFDPETSIELFLGPVGTTLRKTDSGMLDYIETPANMSYSEFRYGNAPVHVPCAIKTEDWGKTIQVMAEDKNKLALSYAHYRPYSQYSSVFVRPNAAESAYLLSGGKDITDYVNKMQVKWLTEGGIEKEWDGYLKELEKLGIAKYMETAQTMVDRTDGK